MFDLSKENEALDSLYRLAKKSITDLGYIPGAVVRTSWGGTFKLSEIDFHVIEPRGKSKQACKFSYIFRGHRLFKTGKWSSSNEFINLGAGPLSIVDPAVIAAADKAANASPGRQGRRKGWGIQ